MRYIKCQDCLGLGTRESYCERGCHYDGTHPCSTCNGYGKVEPDKTLRYWAQKYWSKEKKAKDRAENKNTKIISLKHRIQSSIEDIKEYKKKIKRSQRDIIKYKTQLGKLLK